MEGIRSPEVFFVLGFVDWWFYGANETLDLCDAPCVRESFNGLVARSKEEERG